MLTVRTYRFLGDHSTLSLHECAGRARVLVRLEGDISRGEECALVLNAEQWARLCAFDPFDDRGRALQDVIRALTFRESEDSDLLIVTQVADRDVVQLLMRTDLLADDEDVVGISLDASEWHRLITLDLVSAGDIGTTSMPRPDSRSTYTVH